MENVGQWHLKNRELEALKKKFKKQMAKFNNLRAEYSDWFIRQQGTFMFVIKSMLVTMGSLGPQSVQTISQFRAVIEMSLTMRSAGHRVNGVDKLDLYMSYWDRFCTLRYELDQLMDELNKYVESISTLREPEVKTKMDQFHRDLTYEGSEGYNFADLHNARDNLYTYRITIQDQNFLGLSGYLPYLLTKATKLCFLSTRVNLEKE